MPRGVRIGALVASLLFSSALSGCVGPSGVDGRAGPRTPERPTTATAAHDPPSWFAQREPMPSCGRFEPDEIRFDNPDLPEANACFVEAVQTGAAAELEYNQLTEEGAPGADIYRVIGVGEFEVLLDRRGDPESGLDFGHMVCRELVEGELTLGPIDCAVSDDRRVPPLDQ